MNFASPLLHLYLFFLPPVPQVLLCKRGEDVILVTLNHLDAIRELVSSSDTHVAMVNSACRILTDVSSLQTFTLHPDIIPSYHTSCHKLRSISTHQLLVPHKHIITVNTHILKCIQTHSCYAPGTIQNSFLSIKAQLCTQKTVLNHTNILTGSPSS